MINEYNMLKVDPYNSIAGDTYHISKDVFYGKGVYALPSERFQKKAKESIELGNAAIRLFHINGYAGCGKTLFAHYLIHKYGYSDDYSYGFDHGEGKNYSLEYVKLKMVKQLVYHISSINATNNHILRKFSELGKAVYGEGNEYEMFSIFLYEDEWISTASKTLFDLWTPIQASAMIEDEIKKVWNKPKYTVNDQIKFLLLCDYYWRCAEVLTDTYGTSNKTVFCLLDNLDNLETNATVDLFLDIISLVRNLSESRITSNEYEKNEVAHIRYIYLFPTREITSQRLLDGLRRRGNADLLSNHDIVFPFELENNGASLDRIIKARKKYWATRVSKSEIEKIRTIEKLMEIPYVQRQFFDLLNDNYSYCLDRIIDIWNEMPDWIHRCSQMQSDKKYGDDYAACSREGARGILLRMLLELFKKRNVYDSVTDYDEYNFFNVNGKLGLSELNWQSEPGKYNVSLSRLLMTFIKESNNSRTRINHIFKCFYNIDGKEICRYLFALSENIRDTWRRLIVFTEKMPNKVEDLYKQYEDYVNNPDLPAGDFSEVEICLSGRTYIHSVVPNFEFFLSRLKISQDMQCYPPLFTDDKRADHITSIELVVKSIENCATEMYKFDADMIQKNILENRTEYIDKLFVQNQLTNSAKQSHLSRIIFSHISYIERYRRYLLNVSNQGNGSLSEEGVKINKRIISCILRYLVLFDAEPFKESMNSFHVLLSNEFLPENYTQEVSEKKTCKDIVDLVKGQKFFQQSTFPKNSIELGYDYQKAAQMKLLSKIKEIWLTNYRIISMIEI